MSANVDQNNRPAVNFRFNPTGARKFGDYTANNIGKPFAIVLDEEVISAAFAITDRTERAAYVYNQLRNFAEKSQLSAQQTLQAQFGLTEAARGYTVLWIDNAIAVPNLTAPMLSALAGHTDIAIVTIATSKAQIQSGALVALAITSEKRDAITSLV